MGGGWDGGKGVGGCRTYRPPAPETRAGGREGGGPSSVAATPSTNSSTAPLLAWGLCCFIAVVKDTAFPDCLSEPLMPPRTGPGAHQSQPRRGLCPDVSPQQALVSAWLGLALDVSKARGGSHEVSSKAAALAPSTLAERLCPHEPGPVLWHTHSSDAILSGCTVRNRSTAGRSCCQLGLSHRRGVRQEVPVHGGVPVATPDSRKED